MARQFGGIVEEKRAGRATSVYIQIRLKDRVYKIREFPVRDRWIRFGSKRALAEEVLDEIRSDIRRGVPPLAAIGPYMRRSPLRAFRKYWREWVELQQERADIGQLSRTRARVVSGHEGRGYLDGILETPIDALDYAAMEDLQRLLLARRPALSPKSVHHVLADVRTCLRWLVRRGEIPAAPDVPATQIDPHIPEIPSLEEQAALLAAIPREARGLFLARGLMGLRAEEARRALLEDYRRGERGDELVVRGKGRRFRVVPVHDELAQWVREYRPPLGEAGVPLFPNPETGREWSESAVLRAYTGACKRLGKRWRPNEALRHCFGTRAAERLMGEGFTMADAARQIMIVMGHTSVATSNRYVQMASESLRGVLPK
jgi:integrase